MRTGFIALSLMVASSLAPAQPPQPPPSRHIRETPEQAGQRFEQRLAQNLNLTADQQSKVHTALQEGRVMSQGMMDKLRTLHTSLNAAIKAGNEDQIDGISRDIASLHEQQTAIHAKTTAKIYGSLSPDQKAKVGDHLEMLGGGPGFGPGPGGRGFGGPGPRGRGPGQQ